jgi:hypothetical protein
MAKQKRIRTKQEKRDLTFGLLLLGVGAVGGYFAKQGFAAAQTILMSMFGG